MNMMRKVSVAVGVLCLLWSSSVLGEAIGWRGDGTGRFANADPPTEWAKDKNIVWASKMPAWSNSSPIVVGDRVFVCSESTDLVCCSAANGKILWKKTHEYFDALSPEELPKAQEMKKQGDEITKQLQSVDAEFNKFNGQLASLDYLRKKSDEFPKQIAALPDQLKAAQAELEAPSAELQKTPDNADLKKKVEELKKKVDELTNNQDSLPKELAKVAETLTSIGDEAALKQKVDDLKKQVEALRAKLAPVSAYNLPPIHPATGYSTPTPVSDGRNVYVLAGNGVAACYDLDGNRKWIKIVTKPTNGWGHSASPLLFGDKFIYHILAVTALNKETGEELWKTPDTPNVYGTPVIGKIKGIDALVTPWGAVVRVSDGKLLAKMGRWLDSGSPIVVDGVVYLMQHSGAISFADEPADEFKPLERWTTKLRPNEVYYASPLYDDGIVYAISHQAVLSTIDSKTGAVIYEKQLDLGRASSVFTSLTLAGKYIYASNESGVTVVFEPGREYKQVKRNELGDGFRSSPLFVGKRMYVRGQNNLYCIGQ